MARREQWKGVGAAWVIALTSNAVAFARDAVFHPLGKLGTATTVATGLSSDGSTVIGLATSGSVVQNGFYWTVSGGVRGMPLLNGAHATDVGGVSADGHYATGTLGSRAVRWDLFSRQTMTLGMNFDTVGQGIAGNGSVITGVGGGGVFRWQENTGYQVSVPPYPSTSRLVSGDGSVAVGLTFTPGAGGEVTYVSAWKWTASGDREPIGGMESFEHPSAITPDGIAYGTSGLAAPGGPVLVHLTRWLLNGTRENLSGTLQIDTNAPFGVNATGDVMVMSAQLDGISYVPALWTPGGGLQRLDSFFTARGVDLAGFQITSVAGVSADGMTFTGNGISATHVSQAWIATVPSPSSLIPLITMALAWRRRNRTQLRTTQ